MGLSDKERKAVAVEYGADLDAPVIRAKARGLMVDAMLRLAEEYNITVYRDSDLAESLIALERGSEIPPGLYRAVAEVVAYCYRVNEEFKRKMDQSV